ncbi:MAG: hypothetical protein AAFP84_19505 [Actinomycetota bacterium]
MSDGDLEFVECACYTHARRHPEVLGSLGATTLPFQVTAPALVAFFVTGVVLVASWTYGGWWTWLLPTPVNAMLCVALPVVVGMVAQYVRIEGRSPWSGIAAFARYGTRSRHGVVNGRPAPRGRRGRVSMRGFVCEVER